ncbi:hypothetical protein [Falsiroseomonas oryzae]|uniref:hypothetical protein n=1 Tax=Falsiroseomonas oryzae TaxID=2766473 RepID=UPI0022EA8E64|nr:hypothetical protein [Roseomonas sp. MO-31]
MTDWTLCRWHGPPEAVAAALRTLGWNGPEDAPGAAIDPRVGGFIPPAGEAPREVDGVAYAALVAREALPLPAGLAETPAELSATLIGSF